MSRVHYRHNGYSTGGALAILGVTRAQLLDLETSGRVAVTKTTAGHRRYDLDDINDLSGWNKS